MTTNESPGSTDSKHLAWCLKKDVDMAVNVVGTVAEQTVRVFAVSMLKRSYETREVEVTG